MIGKDPNEEHDDAVTDTADPEAGLPEERTTLPLEVSEADWEDSDPDRAVLEDE